MHFISFVFFSLKKKKKNNFRYCDHQDVCPVGGNVVCVHLSGYNTQAAATVCSGLVDFCLACKSAFELALGNK